MVVHQFERRLAVDVSPATSPAPRHLQVAAVDKSVRGQLLANHVLIRRHRIAALAKEHAHAVDAPGLLRAARDRRGRAG